MIKFTALILFVCCLTHISGHGYMDEPPARNSMWRHKFPNPPNYTDNQNFCGGADYQAKIAKGKCGVCGDPYGKTQRHANGGIYDNGIIVRNYKTGQMINVNIKLTASHLGTFEFRIGPKAVGDSIGKLVGHRLKLADGSDTYHVRRWGGQYIRLQLQLPAGYKCDKCVIQWWYRGGNNWGCDKNGCGKGRGLKQEHFVNCADVSVKDN